MEPLTDEELDRAADGYPPEAFNARARSDIRSARHQIEVMRLDFRRADEQLARTRDERDDARAESARLRAALERIATPGPGPGILASEVVVSDYFQGELEQCRTIARAALHPSADEEKA